MSDAAPARPPITVPLSLRDLVMFGGILVALAGGYGDLKGTARVHEQRLDEIERRAAGSVSDHDVLTRIDERLKRIEENLPTVGRANRP